MEGENTNTEEGKSKKEKYEIREKKEVQEDECFITREDIVSRASVSQSRKTCTKCLVEHPVTEFYSLGNRLDSWCKQCKKEKRKTTYVSSKNDDVFGKIRSCFEIVYKLESDYLGALNDQLERMINKCLCHETP